ncbi:hypothetical protein XENOCAPTIV_026204, partial [Xenoophorus captivus]
LFVFVLQGQWGHVEEIELSNDGSGLGFGIVGGKKSGVVVRTLIPNSVADRDGRLCTGDHILRIGSTPTDGLTSDQVVKVLQACGSHVTMLIARDLRGQKSATLDGLLPPDSAPIAKLPPPLPDSAPITSLPSGPPVVPPQRRLSKTVGVNLYCRCNDMILFDQVYSEFWFIVSAQSGGIRDPRGFSHQEGRPEPWHFHHRLQPADEPR